MPKSPKSRKSNSEWVLTTLQGYHWVLVLESFPEKRFLKENGIFSGSHPLRFGLEKFHKKASFETNKQNFSSFDNFKSSLPSWVLVGSDTTKIYYHKQCKNTTFSLSVKSLLFGAAILHRGLIGLNLKIFSPKMDQMAGKDQNYWFFTKNENA